MAKTERLAEEKTERLVEEIPLMPSLGRLAKSTLIAHRYEVIEELSTHGGEADVFRCLDRESQRVVAVKVYRAHLQPKTELLEVLLNLEHDHIVRLLDFGTYSGRFFEVMEYAAGGTLADHMPYDEKHLKQIVIPQVLSGLKTLHDHNIIHKDIKPTNLFYLDGKRQWVLVGDYGISSLVEGETSLHQSTSVKRTVEFAAGELFSGIFGYEVDYYALGITLLYLLKGKSPFLGMNTQQIVHAHISLEENIHPPADCSQHFKTLIRGLLHKNPKKRWGFVELVRWLKGKDVPVAAHERAFAYRLTPDLTAHSPGELGEMMLKNPQVAQKHIRQPQFYNTFNLYDQALASRLHDIRERARSLNEAFIEIVYTLNPGLPYRLMAGCTATNPVELAQLIDKNKQTWAAGKKQLYDGSILAYLRATGYGGLVSEWEKVAKYFRIG